MTTLVPSLLNSHLACYPVHNLSASLSHVYPPLAWLDFYPVVFIYPSLPSTLAPASLSFSSPAISAIFTPQSLSHTLILLSPPCFPKPRALLQSESHNDLPTCPLLSPIPTGFCVCGIAIREQTGTTFRHASCLSQSLLYPGSTFLLPLAFLPKAMHTRRVFWYSFYFFRAQGSADNLLGLFFSDAILDVYTRFESRSLEVIGCHLSYPKHRTNLLYARTGQDLLL